MKKIITLAICFFSMISLRAQTFPQFYIQGGDTVGVIISIEQAQKIDSDYDLLKLLKERNLLSDKTDSAYVKVINNLGDQVAEIKLKVSTLESLLTTRDSQIKNLKEQITKYQEDSVLAAQQSLKKDTIINNYKKETRRLKTQKFFSFVLNGGLIATIILILVK